MCWHGNEGAPSPAFPLCFAQDSIPLSRCGAKTRNNQGEQSATKDWNLARIAHKGGPLTRGPKNDLTREESHLSASSQDRTYLIKENANGANVAIYVIDAGIRATHPEFKTRILMPDSMYLFRAPTFDDIDGHGTAVASVAAGLTVGAVNVATIIPMKVQTHFTDLVDDVTHKKINAISLSQGIGNAVRHYRDVCNKGQTFGKFKPAIISISITMPADSEVLEEAITVAMAAGIHVVISHAAAGKGANQCSSRIRNLGQITVGATDINDKNASFSNFGPCVDVYAPGESILAADFTSGSDSSNLNFTRGSSL
ncbi:peptidase S8/S53 domain-containing protein [Mycena vulgaris]|nr:peptidase S8/S53 domain-containing protein [Mycena vulgaris]